MEQPETFIYEFDDFRVDTGRRLLLGRESRPLPLTPKAFDTLIFLVQHAGVVLGKETLMRAIWADTAVEENNLNQCISVLRRALGEKRGENRYIVTVPGRGYRFVAPVNKRKPPIIASSAAPILSIAVLPFQPLARDNRDESLEMGMADTLIGKLSSIRNIVVRPMSSVRKYADLKGDVLVAGRELGVESLLEGSLQRQANRVRVTVRLLNVANGASLWAGTFDEELTDIFALQDAISERVAEALSLELSKEEKTRLVKHHTQSTQAYQLYVKGRYYWWKNSPEEYKKSRDYFHRAVEEDPSYALGYCGLNSFYGYGAAWGVMSPDDGWAKAEWSVKKALELDDQLAEASLTTGASAVAVVQEAASITATDSVATSGSKDDLGVNVSTASAPSFTSPDEATLSTATPGSFQVTANEETRHRRLPSRARFLIASDSSMGCLRELDMSATAAPIP